MNTKPPKHFSEYLHLWSAEEWVTDSQTREREKMVTLCLCWAEMWSHRSYLSWEYSQLRCMLSSLYRTQTAGKPVMWSRTDLRSAHTKTGPLCGRTPYQKPLLGSCENMKISSQEVLIWKDVGGVNQEIIERVLARVDAGGWKACLSWPTRLSTNVSVPNVFISSLGSVYECGYCKKQRVKFEQICAWNLKPHSCNDHIM